MKGDQGALDKVQRPISFDPKNKISEMLKNLKIWTFFTFKKPFRPKKGCLGYPGFFNFFDT